LLFRRWSRFFLFVNSFTVVVLHSDLAVSPPPLLERSTEFIHCQKPLLPAAKHAPYWLFFFLALPPCQPLSMSPAPKRCQNGSLDLLFPSFVPFAPPLCPRFCTKKLASVYTLHSLFARTSSSFAFALVSSSSTQPLLFFFSLIYPFSRSLGLSGYRAFLCPLPPTTSCWADNGGLCAFSRILGGTYFLLSLLAFPQLLRTRLDITKCSRYPLQVANLPPSFLRNTSGAGNDPSSDLIVSQL